MDFKATGQTIYIVYMFEPTDNVYGTDDVYGKISMDYFLRGIVEGKKAALEFAYQVILLDSNENCWDIDIEKPNWKRVGRDKYQWVIDFGDGENLVIRVESNEVLSAGIPISCRPSLNSRLKTAHPTRNDQ